ncbi:MAG: PEP-CTERM sorting domain-containing protein [Cyanophyceae cyanobacterium]
MLPNAGTIVNGWNYTVDSFNDGVTGEVGGKYEIYGLGIKQVGNEVIVGIDTRLPIEGSQSLFSSNHIAWGDMFFNFGGGTMSEGNGNFFGVRFAGNNDAGVSETGVYSNVTGQFVDNGFDSVADHASYVDNNGGNSSVGDLASNDSYFDASYNVIQSGTKVGDISLLDSTALAGYGFNLNDVPGTAGQTESDTFAGRTSDNGVSYFGERQSYGFKFELPPGMVGEFVAHLAQECFNDSVAIAGTFAEITDSTDVPEPSLLLGLAGVAGLGLVRRRRQA